LDNWGLGIDLGGGKDFSLFATASKLALGSTHPYIKCIPWALSLGIKWAGYEAEQSPPTSAEVEDVWSYTSTPPNLS